MAPRIADRGALTPSLKLSLEEPQLREDIVTKSGSAPRWVQVAEEGEFAGHSAGPFAFDRDAFEQIVANFQGHPSYEPGLDGVGTARVLAYDFGHASEAHPTKYAASGAPAAAWALELEVRDGDDAKVQMWALTEFLEPALSYVLEGRYQWTSVAVWPDAKDPVTGESIGWYMSSIALTNDPFIQGMVPIAASRTFDDAFAELKRVFDLDETEGLVEVQGKLAKLAAMTTNGATPPPGVDVEGTLAELRRIFRLPTMANAEDVFAEADKLSAKVAQVIPPAQPAAPAATPPIQPPIEPPVGTEPIQQKRTEMSLLKALAGRFGIPADETEIEKAVMLELEEGASASTTLGKLLAALGVTDEAAATAKLQEMLALKDLLPHVESLLGNQVEVEGAAVEEDVEAVTAAYHVPAEFKGAIMAERKGSVGDLSIDGCMKPNASGKTPMQLRQDARTAFMKQYPLAFAKPGDPMHLTRAVATTPTVQSPILRSLSAAPDGRSVSFGSAPMLPAAPPGANAPTDAMALARSIDSHPGRNHIEKAANYIKSQPGGDKKHFDELMSEATDLCRNIRAAS